MIAAWTVGLAEKHVGRNASSHAKKCAASKPGHSTVEAPARSGAISPLPMPLVVWSGEMHRNRSSPLSVDRTPGRHSAACVIGTTFGLAVVPEVCTTSATSSGSGGTGAMGARGDSE